jgi:hypothetical protein
MILYFFLRDETVQHHYYTVLRDPFQNYIRLK